MLCKQKWVRLRAEAAALRPLCRQQVKPGAALPGTEPPREDLLKPGTLTMVSAAPGPKLSHVTVAKTEPPRGQQTILQSHSK